MKTDAVAKELYIAENAVRDQINKFVTEGFIVKEPDGVCKYHPNSADDVQTIEVLEALYIKRRVAVTDTIYRQTGQSMHSFSQNSIDKIEGAESTD